jgi:hypothetical protein
MEFDQRIEELDKLEYPKPNREFIYSTFNDFAAAHPWIGQENIRPKSIAREMFEGFFSFGEYIREYDLQRAEGLLLRYLADVYKAIVQNIPGYQKSDELYEVSVYFSTLIRQIDSSLIDEWEKMRNPKYIAEAATTGESDEELSRRHSDDITRDKRAFSIMIRNEIFRVVKALARGDFEEAKALFVADESAPTEEMLKSKLQSYFDAGHAKIITDGRARAPANVKIQAQNDHWTVQQTLVDPDGHNDWGIDAIVDLALSREAGKPVLKFIQFAGF